jgi:hypothetical protein
MMVQNISRPDVNGTPAKMEGICEQVKEALAGLLPFLVVRTDDNIMSSVEIRGSFDPKEQWANNIFYNSRYFIVFIKPMDGKRYYEATDDKVTLEAISLGLKVGKLRKYTASLEKVVAKLKKWIEGGIMIQ